MTLKDIASVSGKSGLFRVLGPTRAGLILESLDEQKVRSVTPASQKISILEEISIYTTTAEGTVGLRDVLLSVKKNHGDQLPVTPESTAEDLRAFLKTVLPEHDQQRVYISDIKKMVRWYTILASRVPEVFDEKADENTSAQA